MKRLLVASIVVILLSVTVMANLPGESVITKNEIAANSHSYQMGNMEMANVQGGSLAKCLLGIGLAISAPLDTFAGWMVYLTGIDLIQEHCIFV